MACCFHTTQSPRFVSNLSAKPIDIDAKMITNLYTQIESACQKLILAQLVDELSVIATSNLQTRLSAALVDFQSTIISTPDDIPAMDAQPCLDQLDHLQRQQKAFAATLSRTEAALLDDIEDVQTVCHLEQCLTNAWEDAQISQQQTALDDRLNACQHVQHEKEQQMLTEALASECIADFEHMKINELDESITHWQHKYSAELLDVADDEKLFEKIRATFVGERRECEEKYAEMQQVIARDTTALLATIK